MEQASINKPSARAKIVGDLAELIAAADRSHPLRVAIDGIDGAGKTYLAGELAAFLKRRGIKVIRGSGDGFHRPRDYRYRQGRHSPFGYYEDSFDYTSLVSCLLAPLGPGGNRQYKTKLFDYRSDNYVSSCLKQASNNEVLLFDGVFLMRPELREYWDLVIFVQASFEIALDRALRRDIPAADDPDSLRQLFQRRYFPGQQIYLEECQPLQRADIVMINELLESPKLRVNLHDLH